MVHLLHFILPMLLSSIAIVKGETHCRDPADCPLYPLHSCFATNEGLVCKNAREFEGFEVGVDRIETFNYMPLVLHNDTGEPCESIPRSNDLDAYVTFRGPEVIDTGDLDLIGNCSRISYCDKSTRTCLPKVGLDEPCQQSAQCAIGVGHLPGHCNKNTSVCGLRQDIPTFYYGTALRPWTIGEHWKEAAAAVAVTGGIALCFLVGRHQAGKLVSGVSGLIEKWQNRDDQHQQYLEHQQSLSGEELWNQQHSRRVWWHFLPGSKKLARALNLGNNDNAGTYVALDAPPPYRGD